MDVKEQFRRELEKYFHITLGVPDWESRVNNYLTGKHAEQVFANFKSEVSVYNKDVLEIGSGFGGLARIIGKKAKSYTGVEPSMWSQIAKKRFPNLKNVKFTQSYGENLPFKSNSFDIVICYDVLEHVTDPQKVIHEIVRVLRPEGEAILKCPTYTRFYEPHYMVFYVPLCPRILGKLYLRFRGRDPSFLDTINYITRRKLYQLLVNITSQGQTVHLEYYDYGLEEIKRKLRDPTRIANRKKRAIACLFKRLGLSTVLFYGLKYIKAPIQLKIKKYEKYDK